jgi:hypothetical protein
MPCFYLTPKQDDFNKIPELQVCIAEALYDVDSIVGGPRGLHKRATRNLTQSDSNQPPSHVNLVVHQERSVTNPTQEIVNLRDREEIQK